MRIGVVGCGEQGSGTLLPCLLAMRGASVIAVCDIDAACAQATAERWRIPTWFDNVSPFFDSEIVDALVLAASPQAHVEILSRVLPAKIPVFIEKPPAASLLDIELLAAIAREYRAFTQIGYNFRFAPAVIRMQSLLRQQDFGSPVLFSARYLASWPRGDRWQLGNPLRAFLLTHFIHLVDLTLYLFGRAVDVVTQSHVDHKSGIIVVQVEIEFESGLRAHLESTNAAPRFHFEMSAVGSAGAAVRVSGLRRVEFTHADDRQQCHVWEPGQFEQANELAGYRGELQAFVDSRTEENARVPSLESSLSVYQILERIM